MEEEDVSTPRTYAERTRFANMHLQQYVNIASDLHVPRSDNINRLNDIYNQYTQMLYGWDTIQIPPLDPSSMSFSEAQLSYSWWWVHWIDWWDVPERGDEKNKDNLFTKFYD